MSINIIENLKKQVALLLELIALYKDAIKLRKNEMMVRRVCKEEGLGQAETDLICQVIHCESGFDDRAINTNKDKTQDLGIIQANSYWYIEKRKLLTREEAIDNPEKCVRVMIDRYRKGFLKDWVCYSSGLFSRYTASI